MFIKFKLSFREEIEKLEEIYYWFYRFFNKIKGIPFEIRCFYQRGTRGWSDRDVWSIDYHLDRVIPPMIRQLKNSKMLGFPNTFKCPEGCICNINIENNCEPRNEWHIVLDKIALGFEAHKDMMDMFHEDPIIKDYWNKRIPKGSKDIIKELNKELSHEVEEVYKNRTNFLQNKAEQEIKAGMELFIKYYSNLWD